MDDSKIVQLYWDRNELAIPATSEKYGNYCASIARNILGNQEDAEECVNDAYMSAWNSMPPHRPNILPAFLGKIVRNLSFTRYKRNTADKCGGGEAPVVLDEIAELVSDTDSVEQLVGEELERYLLTGAGCMPPDGWQALNRSDKTAVAACLLDRVELSRSVIRLHWNW